MKQTSRLLLIHMDICTEYDITYISDLLYRVKCVSENKCGNAQAIMVYFKTKHVTLFIIN